MCTSLKEDNYGTVQRDIPRILEALLSFLTALEDFRKEGHAKHPEPSPEEWEKLNPEERNIKHREMVDMATTMDLFGEVSDRKLFVA